MEVTKHGGPSAPTNHNIHTQVRQTTAPDIPGSAWTGRIPLCKQLLGPADRPVVWFAHPADSLIPPDAYTDAQSSLAPAALKTHNQTSQYTVNDEAVKEDVIFFWAPERLCVGVSVGSWYFT